MKKNEYIIVVAGGSGNRMNTEIPKQFIKLNKIPVIVLTIRKFIAYNHKIKIIIAVIPEYKNHLESLCNTYFPEHTIQITNGGSTRFESVKNALKLISSTEGVVGVHDAARPFVSNEVIKNCFKQADKLGNAIPAIDLNESLRKVISNKNTAVNRSEYKVIQTPQCFKIDIVKKAFLKRYSKKFTDDATVVESIGIKINLIQGNPENIKITHPIDLLTAKAFLTHAK